LINNILLGLLILVTIIILGLLFRLVSEGKIELRSEA
jgi:hypothetical protein